MHKAQHVAAMLRTSVTQRAALNFNQGLIRNAVSMQRDFIPPSPQPAAPNWAPTGQLGGSTQNNSSPGFNPTFQQYSVPAENAGIGKAALTRDTWDGQNVYHRRSFTTASSCSRASKREASGTWVLEKTPAGWRGFAGASTSSTGGGSRGPSAAKLRAVPFIVTRSEAVAEYEAYHRAHWMFKRPSNGNYRPSI